MNRMKRKAVLLAAALFMSTIMCMTSAYMPVYAEEAAEAESGNKKAVPVLVVEGNTIYVDASADGPWNVIQGTVRFDPTEEVESYGMTEEFAAAVAEQGVMGFPAYNVTDEGEFIFTAAYTAAEGTGVECSDHLFYITFKDVSEPIDFTMYDEFNYELLSAAVDGAPEAVTYAPSAEVVAANEAQHEADRQAAAEQNADPAEQNADPAEQNDANQNADNAAEEEKEGSSRNVLLFIVVIAVVVLAAVAVVVSRKNGQPDEEAADGQDAPENEAVKITDGSDQDKD